MEFRQYLYMFILSFFSDLIAMEKFDTSDDVMNIFQGSFNAERRFEISTGKSTLNKSERKLLLAQLMGNFKSQGFVLENINSETFEEIINLTLNFTEMDYKDITENAAKNAYEKNNKIITKHILLLSFVMNPKFTLKIPHALLVDVILEYAKQSHISLHRETIEGYCCNKLEITKSELEELCINIKINKLLNDKSSVNACLKDFFSRFKNVTSDSKNLALGKFFTKLCTNNYNNVNKMKKKSGYYAAKNGILLDLLLRYPNNRIKILDELENGRESEIFNLWGKAIIKSREINDFKLNFKNNLQNVCHYLYDFLVQQLYGFEKSEEEKGYGTLKLSRCFVNFRKFEDKSAINEERIKMFFYLLPVIADDIAKSKLHKLNNISTITFPFILLDFDDLFEAFVKNINHFSREELRQLLLIVYNESLVLHIDNSTINSISGNEINEINSDDLYPEELRLVLKTSRKIFPDLMLKDGLKSDSFTYIIDNLRKRTGDLQQFFEQIQTMKKNIVVIFFLTIKKRWISLALFKSPNDKAHFYLADDLSFQLDFTHKKINSIISLFFKKNFNETENKVDSRDYYIDAEPFPFERDIPSLEQIFNYKIPPQIKCLIPILKNPILLEGEAYRNFNSGLLLFGPAGTGKNTVVQHLVEQSKRKIFYKSGGNFSSVWKASTQTSLSKLFYAAENFVNTSGLGAIVFIDEADGIMKSANSQDSTDHSEVISAVKTLMNSYLDHPNIFVILATNNKNSLDKAILNRFTKLSLDLPNYEARKQILEFYCKKNNVKIFDDCEAKTLLDLIKYYLNPRPNLTGNSERIIAKSFLNLLAVVTDGLSARDLKNIVWQATLKHLLNLDFEINKSRVIDENVILANYYLGDDSRIANFFSISNTYTYFGSMETQLFNTLTFQISPTTFFNAMKLLNVNLLRLSSFELYLYEIFINRMNELLKEGEPAYTEKVSHIFKQASTILASGASVVHIANQFK